ncbi:MAG: gas vesicle protein [bacterium]|nr:gas vesicle protein [bacterium]
MPDLSLRDDTEHVTLCEALDRVLNKGAVVVGDLTISVANIDLIYLGLQVILSSVETAREVTIPKEIKRIELTNEPC